MIKRTARVFVFIFIILIASLMIGYSYTAVREIRSMDLYHASARNVGIVYTAGNYGEASSPDEKEAAEYARDFLQKQMSGSGVTCDISIDYTSKCIVCRMLTDGIAEAAQDGDDEKWESVCNTGEKVSLSWYENINEGGLDGWDFSVIVLNDYYPKNALLIFTDGHKVYDCRDGSFLL